MVLGYVLGAIIGINVGNQVRLTRDIWQRSVTLPRQVAKRVMVPKLPPPKTYDYIDALADSKEEFREEWNTEAKDDEVKRVLARTPYWCTFPDYERVCTTCLCVLTTTRYHTCTWQMLWLNNFIEIIWKQNGAATFKTVQQVLTDGMPEWSKLTV